MKNGLTSSRRQRWRCRCGASQTNRKPGKTAIATFTGFQAYLLGKHSQAEIAGNTGRTLRKHWAWCWNVPTSPVESTGEVYSQVFIDGIYLPHGWCLLIARNQDHVVAWQWSTSENSASYRALLSQIAPPDLVTTDGAGGALKTIRILWPDTPVQRCLIHVHRNNLRDLTSRPQTPAGKALLGLSRRLLKISTLSEATRWSALLVSLHTEYATYLAQRTYARDVPPAERRAGRLWWYTHERDRSVYHRLARLQQDGVLFAYLESDPVCERTTNPVESINAQIRILTHAHRGMSESHLITMLDWFLYTHTENPSSPSRILADWDQDGRPTRRIIPKKTTPSLTRPTVSDMPVHYDTAISAEEGLWARKGWAGRSK